MWFWLTGGCGARVRIPPAMCRGSCDEADSSGGVGGGSGNPEGPPTAPFPVADQPKPEAVAAVAAGKSPTVGAPRTGEYPPAERTRFVVHVEAAAPPAAESASPTSEALHHHHRPESNAGNGGGSRRRHHRLPCWTYEERERQCLNGGRCFAIQLHNGIRRSGCRLATDL